MPHLISASLASPGTLTSISFPSSFSTRTSDAPLEPSVQSHSVQLPAASEGKWGTVDRIASSHGVQGLDDGLLALAHSTSLISLVPLKEKPRSSAPSASSCEVVQTYKTSAIKPSNKHVSLDFLPSGHLLHSTSGGALSLFPLPSSNSAPTEAGPSKTRLPAGITTLRPSLDGKSFAYAGKEVDVSVWDVERAFAAQPAAAAAVPEPSKKRKAGKESEKLLHGEIWRARNIPNDHLSLRPAISHTALTYFPSTSPHQLATGTSSGHIRTYDPRSQSRRPTNNWLPFPSSSPTYSVTSADPIASLIPTPSGHGLWFTSTISPKIGLLDARTGRLLYTYNQPSATCHDMLALGRGEEGILAGLGRDGTMGLYRTSEVPEDVKATPAKGALAASVHAVVGGVVVGWEGDLPAIVYARPGARGRRREVVEQEEQEEEEEENLWQSMGTTGQAEEEEDEDSDDDVEDPEEGIVVTVEDEARVEGSSSSSGNGKGKKQVKKLKV